MPEKAKLNGRADQHLGAFAIYVAFVCRVEFLHHTEGYRRQLLAAIAAAIRRAIAARLHHGQ